MDMIFTKYTVPVYVNNFFWWISYTCILQAQGIQYLSSVIFAYHFPIVISYYQICQKNITLSSDIKVLFFCQCPDIDNPVFFTEHVLIWNVQMF